MEMSEVEREREETWSGMRLTQWRRKLVTETLWSMSKRAIGNSWRRWCRWMSESYKWSGARALGRLNGDDVVQMWRLGGTENFVSKWQELVFSGFNYPQPVKRAKDWKFGMMWQDLGVLTMARAREFCICRRFREVVVKRIALIRK